MLTASFSTKDRFQKIRAQIEEEAKSWEEDDFGIQSTEKKVSILPDPSEEQINQILSGRR